MKPRSPDRRPTSLAAESPSPVEESLLSGLIKSWDRFWFTPADPIGLGLLRIIGGVLILYVHLSYSFDLLSYVGGDRAWVDVRTENVMRKEAPIFAPANNWTDSVRTGQGNYAWSIFFHVTDPAWVSTIHYAFLGVIALFTIGLWTRITTVITWMACLCYIQRTTTLVFGLDAMMAILMFYMMIGPCGATLSVDRWLEIRRARKLFGPDNVPEVQPSVLANIALRGMQVHFCFIYLAAGTSKLLGPRWWSGAALWYCYANYSFAPMNVPAYNAMLVFLCQNRWLWEIVMSGGAAFTLFMEIGLPFLIWHKKLRWLMVCGAVMLHMGIGLIMGLVTFSMVMLCLVFSFIPPEAIRYFLKEVGRPLNRLLPGQTGKKGIQGKPALAMSKA
jgi:Vitamin K-dependent gamma-carboxylase